jgi:peptidoglycan/xylan/chitin deacetylase (PgdA/CDA1 family)
VIDEFESFDENWSVASGHGSAQSKVIYHGEKSVLLDSAGDRRVRITRSFDGYRDLSGLDFSLAVCLLGTSKAAIQPHVVVRDVNGNHRVYSASLSSVAPNRWVRLDLGVEADEGVDMSIVDSIAVGEYVDDRESQFLVDDLQVREKPDTGLIAFSFEDSHRLDHDLAYPALTQHDFDGAIFAPAASMTESEEPSLSEFETLRDVGWDVGAHTMQHERLPDFSREEQRQILEDNIQFLQANGFERGRHHFRTTKGAYDTNTQNIVRELFETTIVPQGKATGTAAHVTDPYMIGFKGGDDYERSKRLADVAAEHRQFLGLTLHMRRVDDHEAFRSLIDHIGAHVRRGDLRVVTPSEHYREYVEPNA